MLGSVVGVGSDVDGGVLVSLVGAGVDVGVDVDVDVGVGSALELGVSGSCASAPVVTAPNASTAAVVSAPILSRARLTDLSDKGIPPRMMSPRRRQAPARVRWTRASYRSESRSGKAFPTSTSTVDQRCEVALKV
ncbi:hypothetical protein GCM10027200_30750 [Lentzea nigeriaca]